MIAKIHKKDGKSVLALCDSDLLGKVFEEKGFILDLSSEFFNGKEVSKEKIRPYLKRVYVVNAVGKESTSLVLEAGLTSKADLKSVKGVPHIQVINMAM
jgi:uncharacterized protein